MQCDAESEDERVGIFSVIYTFVRVCRRPVIVIAGDVGGGDMRIAIEIRSLVVIQHACRCLTTDFS